MHYKHGEVNRQEPDAAIMAVGILVIGAFALCAAAWFTLLCIQNYWLEEIGRALRIW